MIYLLCWQLKLAKEEKVLVQADEASAAQQREQLSYVQAELAAKGDQLKDLEGQLTELHSEIAAKDQLVNDSITREQDARGEIRRLVGVTENMVRMQEKDSKYLQELHENDKQNMVILNRLYAADVDDFVCAGDQLIVRLGERSGRRSGAGTASHDSRAAAETRCHPICS